MKPQRTNKKAETKSKASVQSIASPGTETYEAKKARWAAELDLRDLGNSERAFLAVCQDIYRREYGPTTPFEEFFASLVFWCGEGSRPTPDCVTEEFEIFRRNWRDMKRDAADFVRAYGEETTKERNVREEIARRDAA